MAITVNTILSYAETPFKLKLLAGRSGLSKNVSWIYFTEDSTTINFIRGGELAITTCLNLANQNLSEDSNSKETEITFLKEFVDNFIKHNASGLIINIGKYLPDVPKDVIDYCDEKGFPLFSMPWEIHTIDLMQGLGTLISSDNHKNQSMEKFFYYGIFEKQKFNPLQIENTSFHNASSFSIGLLETNEQAFNNDLEQLKRYVYFNLNPRMNISQTDYCCFLHNHKIIYVIKNSNTDFSSELFRVVQNDKYFREMKIAISDSSNNINDLEELYNHAQITMNLEKNAGQISRYDKLGIYKILLEVKNERVIEQFYEDILGKIEQLETSKREDYLKTLSLYLKLGGNIHSVSEINNTHRNTVQYRIQRLEEVLGIDLQDGDTRCLLQIALYFRKLLKQK